MWWGMHMGLSYRETLWIPLTQLLDMIAIEQIKLEGFDYVPNDWENEMDLDEMLRMQ